MTKKLDKIEILKQIKNQTISPQEGLKLLKNSTSPAIRQEIRDKDVAIIGMSAKLPGADNLDQFWQNLKGGYDSVGVIPLERWDYRDYYEPDPEAIGEDKSYCKYGGFISGANSFDPQFFSISPNDATVMDPQERLLLQNCWHTLEDAGYSRERINRDYPNMGVYIGETTNTYALIGAEEWDRGNPVISPTLPWSMANRISYILNIQGPSITMDTACSSSLVALHQAVQAIRQKEISLALVGGVNLYLHPSKYVWLSKMKMISPSGHSHSFGADADGFCPGEGVVSVLLKSAKEAIQDDDTIYGIIKGSAVNHDGKTTGYTVPNPNAQASLIKSALKDAEVSPCEISLIEAHGTGTKLGDPIEIRGITKAFEETTNRGFCAISSAKSNIGHLESAAGLAGLVKVLLQMKYKSLVPSLHCTPPNPVIDFSQTPVKVQQDFSPWNTPKLDNSPILRKAGVSSFGAGGVNAHVIVEEYQQTKNSTATRKSTATKLFLLSAHTKSALRELIKQYLSLLENLDDSFTLQDLAITTALHRTHLSLRIALTVSNFTDLKRHLELLQSEPELHSFLAKNRELSIDEAYQWSDWEGVVNALADSYRAGGTVPFEKIYKNRHFSPVSLPQYPFSTKEYLIERTQKVISETQLHPLLGKNCSDFEKTIFNTRFSGTEFFLKDHIVAKNKTLPGVAYLEMALQAIHEVTGEWYNSFSQVHWPTPFLHSNDSGDLTIEIKQEDSKIHFQVYSANSIHAEGLCSKDTRSPHRATSNSVTNPNEEYKSEFIYSHFITKGLHYGETFRPIVKTHKLQEKSSSILTLSPDLQNSFKGYRLHPALLDGALQTTFPFTLQDDMMLPFVLEELHIHTPLLSLETFSVETKLEKENKESKSFNISIVTQSGTPHVSVKGFTLKEAGRFSHTNEVPSLINYIKPEWIEEQLDDQEKYSVPIAFISNKTNRDHKNQNNFIFNCSFTKLQSTLNDLAATTKKSPVSLLIQHTEETDSDTIFEDYLSLINTIMKHFESDVEIVLFSDTNTPYFQLLTGLLITASAEFPRLYCKHMYIKNSNKERGLQTVLKESATFHKFLSIQYNSLIRYVKEYNQCFPSIKKHTFKAEKVYLITGGLGGIGRVIASYLTNEIGAKVILVGRTQFANPDEKCAEICKDLHRIEYIQCDISNKNSVEKLFTSTPPLTGIIHSAGINKDSLITVKTKDEYHKVLKTKVEATELIDAFSKDQRLDFFVLFSSIASLIGNPGQSDYASANSFLNAFAEDRNRLVEKRKRYGKTISIQWPLWEKGGMRVSDEKSQYFKDSWGMEVMPNELGLEAFKIICQNDEEQVLPFKGDFKKLLLILNSKARKKEKNNKATTKAVALLLNDIRTILSEITGYETDHIEDFTTLDELGFDSIKITDLTNRCNKKYALRLSAAIFFEYMTPQAISTYLLESFPEEISLIYGTEESPLTTNDEIIVENLPTIKPTEESPQSSLRQDNKTTDIAVIGMAGKFPSCPDITSFWHALESKMDCISTVPSWRWDSEAVKEKGVPQFGGFIDDIESFDPLFFGISPAEAEHMDPQQRIFLETVWHVIEDSGYKSSDLSESKTGLYLGVSVNDYAELMEKEGIPVKAQSSIGSVHSMIVNRISFLLNLRGPSEPIDTACSSSLVALHRAIQDMQNGNASMAIVGGVNELLSPKLFESFHKAGMLSPDGRCKTFDAKANGYVRAEGVGAIMLKPLEKAEADNDAIYAVIKGSAVNHGGRAKSLTAPNPKAQTELLQEAYKNASVPLSTVSYIETHGTGTALGDPIEIHALQSAFRKENVPVDTKCYLGSVKTNVGHLESAAGITGIIKVLLSMRHKKIPGTVHFNDCNPQILLEDSSLTIVQNTLEWEKPHNAPRRAGVSSFGFGGVNAHVVLEEYTPTSNVKHSDSLEFLFPFSAKSRESLLQNLKQFKAFLASNSAPKTKQYQDNNNDQSDTNKLIASISTILSIPEEDVDMSLSPMDLGIDPVIAHEILARYNQLTGTSIPLKSFLQASSIQELVPTEEIPANQKNSHYHDPNITAENIAYTLQIGREEFRYRVMLKAGTLTDLQNAIQDVLANPKCIVDMKKSKESDMLSLFSDDSGTSFIADLVQNRNFDKLKQLWLHGVTIDWKKLWNSTSARRVHLPGYQFEKKPYWYDSRFEENADSFGETKGRIQTSKEEINNLCVEKSIINIISSLLKIPADQIKKSNRLDELGLDSILLLQFLQNTNKEFNIELSLTNVAQCSTVSDLLSLFSEKTKSNEFVTSNSLNETDAFFNDIYSKAFEKIESYTIQKTPNSFGLETEVFSAGAGEPILFLNGLGMTFASLAKPIELLQKKYRVIVINYPGIGNSDSFDKVFTINDIEIVLQDTIREFNLTSFHLIGWSMGGFIAQHYAEKHPTNIKTLTLVNSSYFLEGEFTTDSVHKMQIKVSETFSELLLGLPSKTQEEYKKSIIGTLNIEDTFKSYEFAFNFNAQRTLFALKVPTLLICSKEDEIIKHSFSYDIAEHNKQFNTITDLKVVSKGNHYVPIFNPKELVLLFHEFVTHRAK